MKRAALALLAFLGVACIVAAIAIPTYLVPKLKVVPLDLDITSLATSVPSDGDAGDRFPAVIFDRCSVTKSKAATLDAHLTQQRRSVIIEPSDATQATLQSGQTLQIDRIRDARGKETEVTMSANDADRKCDDGLLNATVDRVSVDRESSAPNGNVSSLQLAAVPEGGNIDEVSVKLENRQGFQYKFGFDVQKRDYYYYDTTTRQDAVAKFVGEKTIDGVKTFHFQADVPEVNLSDLPDAAGEAPLGTILNMPAKWWGIKGKGVKSNDMITMHRFGKAVRNVYVEPTTGTIIFGEEDQEQYFKSPDDSGEAPKAISDFRMTAMKSKFAWTDETVAQQAERADKYLSQLRWGGTIVPIILGIVGAVLLLAWALLVWFGRRGDNGGPAGEVLDESPDGPNPGDGGNGSEAPTPEAQTPEAQTTVIPAPGAHAAAPYSPYEDGPGQATTVLPPLPEDPQTQAFGAYQSPDAAAPYYQQEPQTQAFAPGAHEQPPVASPADVTDTEAFRAPETPNPDGFSPYTTDPTRPMPDFDRYRREP